MGAQESRDEGLERQEVVGPGESRKLAQLRQQAVKCLTSSCIFFTYLVHGLPFHVNKNKPKAFLLLM